VGFGRVGIITSTEKHDGGFDMAHVKDSNGNNFTTRMNNLFVLGKGKKSSITLPKNQGLKLSILDERKRKMSSG
jgi:small subunit ribosomal protein S4e